MDNFGGRKSEDFAENPLPHISMFTSSRVWSDFGRISQQIRGFQIDYECGLLSVIGLISYFVTAKHKENNVLIVKTC
jgi:hypothetical protein